MPRVLNVGQCSYDHGSIARQLKKSFDAEVVGASSFPEAVAALRGGEYDLILVNRVNDRDGSPGLDLIRTVKADPALAGVPVMLVSNYPEAQQQAEALGALPGFGKAELGSARSLERLSAVLADRPAPTGPA